MPDVTRVLAMLDLPYQRSRTWAEQALSIQWVSWGVSWLCLVRVRCPHTLQQARQYTTDINSNWSGSCHL